VGDPRIDQIKDHLYTGLALMDLVGHIDELHTLWRRNSVAYAMRLAWREWAAADALLSDLAEDLHEACGGGRRAPRPQRKRGRARLPWRSASQENRPRDVCSSAPEQDQPGSTDAGTRRVRRGIATPVIAPCGGGADSKF